MDTHRISLEIRQWKKLNIHPHESKIWSKIKCFRDTEYRRPLSACREQLGLQFSRFEVKFWSQDSTPKILILTLILLDFIFLVSEAASLEFKPVIGYVLVLT